jgi:hypothetical protein
MTPEVMEAKVLAVNATDQKLCDLVGLRSRYIPYSFKPPRDFSFIPHRPYLDEIRSRNIEPILCSKFGERCISFGHKFNSPQHLQCSYYERREDIKAGLGH